MIIVNDGSTDSTGALARKLATGDARVRLITLPQNQGKPHAMNVAVGEARGRWVAVLDADDWFAPNRLSTLLAAAEREGVDLIADNQFLYDDGAARVVRTAFPGDGDRLLSKKLFAAGSDPYADFDFGMLKPMVRRDFIRSAGLHYRESARLSEDFLYLVEFLAAGGRAFLLAQPLYYWRQAFGSISHRWTETGNGSWRYDFRSAAAATTEVLHGMPAQEHVLIALLEGRRHAFERLHVLQEVNRMRSAGASTRRLLRVVLAHPMVWPLVLQRVARRIRRQVPLAVAQRA